MNELIELAIDARNKENGDRDTYLAAWDALIKKRFELGNILGSVKVNKAIDTYFYGFG